MATQLVQLKDGIWVEADINETARQTQDIYSKSGVSFSD